MATSTITEAQAFKTLAHFPHTGFIARIKHIRAEHNLGLGDAKTFVEAFRDKQVPMAVEIISESPGLRSPAFPILPAFHFPENLAVSVHRKELKVATAHLAKKLGKLKLDKDAPDGMSASTAINLQNQLVSYLMRVAETL